MPQMNKITFTVGQGFDKNQNPINGLEAKRKVALFRTAFIFGGYSAVDAAGGWMNAKGDLIVEQSLVISTLTDKDYDVAEEHGQLLAELFNQESVMVTVEVVPTVEFIGQGPEKD